MTERKLQFVTSGNTCHQVTWQRNPCVFLHPDPHTVPSHWSFATWAPNHCYVHWCHGYRIHWRGHWRWPPQCHQPGLPVGFHENFGKGDPTKVVNKFFHTVKQDLDRHQCTDIVFVVRIMYNSNTCCSFPNMVCECEVFTCLYTLNTSKVQWKYDTHAETKQRSFLVL